MSSGFRNVFERLAYSDTQSSAMKKRWARNEFESPSPSVRSSARSVYTHSSRSVRAGDHSVFDRLAGTETYATSSMKDRTERPRPSSTPRKTSNAFFERLATTETFASAMMKGLISQEELNLRSPDRERDSSTGRSVRSASSAKSAKSAKSARSMRTSVTTSSFFERMSKAQTVSSASKKGQFTDRSPRYGGLPPSPMIQQRASPSTFERLYKSDTSKSSASRQNKNVMSSSPTAYSSRFSQSHSPSHTSPYAHRPSSAYSSEFKSSMQPSVAPRVRPSSASGRPRSALKSSQRPPAINTSRSSISPRPQKMALSPSLDTSIQMKKSHALPPAAKSPAVTASKKTPISEVKKPTPREALVFESDDELSFGDESEASFNDRKDQPQDAGKDLEKSGMTGLSTSFAAASVTNEEDDYDASETNEEEDHDASVANEDEDHYASVPNEEDYHEEEEADHYSNHNNYADDDSFDELDEVLADTYDQEEPVIPTESNDYSQQEYMNSDQDGHEDDVDDSPAFEEHEEDNYDSKLENESHHSEQMKQDLAEPEDMSDDGLSVGSDASDDEWLGSPSQDNNKQNESQNDEEQRNQNGLQFYEAEDDQSDSIQVTKMTSVGVENVDSLDLVMADTSVDGDEETAYEDHSYATEDKVELHDEPSEMVTEDDYKLPTYKLLKSEKYHPEYGFEVQDTDELYLTETLQAWEQGEISNHEIAVLIIEAFFERDFENGEHWEVDAGTARDLEEDEGGGADLEGRAFVVKRQARLDWNDLYSVAAAKGTIIIYPEKKEVRVENYSYFVAG
jgi:hypothetical protein